MNFQGLLNGFPQAQKRQVQVGLLAGVLGLVLYSSKEGEAHVPTTEVVGIGCAIPLGKAIDSKCLRLVSVPTVVAGDFVSAERFADLVGRRAMVELAPDTRLVPSMFQGGVDGKLVAVPTGYRALRLERTNAPEGSVPGAHVDLVLGQRVVASNALVVWSTPLTVAVPSEVGLSASDASDKVRVLLRSEKGTDDSLPVTPPPEEPRTPKAPRGSPKSPIRLL